MNPFSDKKACYRKDVRSMHNPTVRTLTLTLTLTQNPNPNTLTLTLTLTVNPKQLLAALQ